MYSSMLVGLALIAGAPAAKETPKKDPALVGDWVAEKFSIAGMDLPVPKDDELRFKFEKDGKLTILESKGKPEVGSYKLDLKKDPPEIDLLPPKDSKDKVMLGIFSIEGDKLMLCLAEEKSGARPTKFESSKESPYILMTFKRVKK